MACFTCQTGPFRSISRAMAKATAARVRRVGVLRTEANWAAKAAVCERCPLRVVVRGVSHCGTPFLQQVSRDPTIDGCGCPTRDKAKAPGEHCPVDARYGAAATTDGACSCKWCSGEIRMTKFE